MRPFDRSLVLAMLAYGRPHLSATESAFITRFISPLPGAWRDAGGNWHVQIGESPILWSCHTDTVHRSGVWQTLHQDPTTGIVGLSKRSRRASECLGADDTAGIAICVQMIHSRVPGHYVFHTGEEVGGIGSSWLAEHGPDLLSGVTFAIALDRKGYSDVITHQAGRCCSDAFAESLATALNATTPVFTYKPDSTGVFTDTANYTDLVGECTNLSVGYRLAHSPLEVLDLAHVERLYAALCRLDPADLVASRQPGDYEAPTWTNWSYSFHNRDWAQCECSWCSMEYDISVSDAREPLEFCSDACERDFYYRGIYLDRTQGQVQAFLKRQTLEDTDDNARTVIDISDLDFDDDDNNGNAA